MGIIKKNKNKSSQEELDKAAHVKENTLGTSNEISLSVLDAAKEKAVEQLKTEQKEQKSSFSKTLSSSFADEVAKKKSKRKKKRLVIIALICLFVLAVVFLLIFSIHAYMQRANNFSNSYREAIDCVSQTDYTISQVNEILENPTSSTSRQVLSNIETDIQTSKELLDECQELLEPMQENKMLPTENEKVYQLQNSLDGRVELLNAGSLIIKQIKSAFQSMDSLESSKAKVEEANNMEQNAANLIANPTTENIDAAKAATESAIQDITSAISLLSDAKTKCPQADLGDYTLYLSYKKEALENQLQALQAVQNEDSAAARTSQTAYENADEKARSYASSVSRITDPVLSVYENNVQELSEQYELSRTKVAAADEYLRAHM